MTAPILLALDHMSIALDASGTVLVDDVSFHVRRGECLGLVGESGSGKSLTLRGILGLLPPGLTQTAGTISFAGSDGVLGMRDPVSLRGSAVSMVFQEPMSSLNPSMRVLDLVAAGARASGMRRREANIRALELLDLVGFPDPTGRGGSWPHELSGGLRQRVMIAMALSVNPGVLLCDEPTTALDVTIQDQILTLLESLRSELGLAMIFVSHDLAVVSRIADRTAVLYAGSIVEEAPTRQLIVAPAHPYTRGLIDSIPRADLGRRRLTTIDGAPPLAGSLPAGCNFAPRCPHAEDRCLMATPPLLAIGPARLSACLRHEELLAVTA